MKKFQERYLVAAHPHFPPSAAWLWLVEDQPQQTTWDRDPNGATGFSLAEARRLAQRLRHRPSRVIEPGSMRLMEV